MALTTAPTKKQHRETQSKPGAPPTAAAKRVRTRAPRVTRKAHDAAPSPALKADDMASYVGRKTDAAAAYAGHKTEDAVSYVGHKAEDAASFVGHKAEDAASYVGHKTEDASAALGGRLRSLGDTVRARGPEGGMAADALSAVADTLDSSGRYLQEEGVKDVAEDVTNLIRRYPIPALLIGLAAGYLVAKGTAPRS